MNTTDTSIDNPQEEWKKRKGFLPTIIVGAGLLGLALFSGTRTGEVLSVNNTNTLGSSLYGDDLGRGRLGSIKNDQEAVVLEHANWTVTKVDKKKCEDSIHKRDVSIIPGEKVDGIFFYDDDKDDPHPIKQCWQLLEGGSSLITAGKCLPWENKVLEDHSQRADNGECLGRCGPGCSDDAVSPLYAKKHSRWSKNCLTHDVCTFLTESKAGTFGPFSSKTCATIVKSAARAEFDPRFTWEGGDSSYNHICNLHY